MTQLPNSFNEKIQNDNKLAYINILLVLKVTSQSTLHRKLIHKKKIKINQTKKAKQ